MHVRGRRILQLQTASSIACPNWGRQPRVLAWLVSSQTRNVLPAAGVSSELVHNIPVFVSLAVSLLSGMTAFLNLNDLAIRHRTAAENLNALWRNCRYCETDFPDASFCEAAVKAVQGYRARLNDINGDAP